MRIVYLFLALMLFMPLQAQQGEIRLLVRGDDIGSSQAANQACINSYRNGIMRSVELMVPCPWFLDAARLLKENPGLDVGIHLVLNSEWAAMKWRPLTCAPSLVDSNGYFYPMVWQNDAFGPNTSLQKAQWDLREAEQELRAQIEMALKHVPNITHIGGHMGFAGLSDDLRKLVDRLAAEYKLETEFGPAGIKHFKGWGKERTFAEREKAFIKAINELTPGDYLFVDHPGVNTPEMQFLGHKGYEDVAVDRDAVTKIFTSAKVKKALEKKGVKLVSYADFKK